MRSGILAGGNWIVDYGKILDVFPEQDTLANILDETVCNGGSPYNILVDLAKAGAPFPLEGVGLIGDDEAGAYIRKQCADLGIDTSQLHTTTEAPTSYTLVMTAKQTGRRTFFHCRGANALLSPEQFNFEKSNAKIFHLGYLLLLDLLDTPCEGGNAAALLLKRASEAGMRTSIDVVSEDSNRYRDVVIPALPYCDFCFMNELEAERTTGIALRQSGVIDRNKAVEAAHKLLGYGVREWVIIHFPEGCVAYSNQAFLNAGSIQVPKEAIKSTVGAGDAFAAGVLYGLHEGEAIAGALHYGLCMAASSMLDASTSGGILLLSQCLAMGKRYGCRPALSV